MSRLWLLRGPRDAPGWEALRADMKEERVNVVHIDPRVWAMVSAEAPPDGYAGITAAEPPDGLYLDPNGSPLYVAGGAIVPSGREVIAALGRQAEDLLERIGDAETVLERLGRAF